MCKWFQMLEATQAEKFSLEDDILVLEKGLPLQVFKYHSQVCLCFKHCTYNDIT